MKFKILNGLLLLYMFQKRDIKGNLCKNGLYCGSFGFNLLFEQNFGMQQQWR